MSRIEELMDGGAAVAPQFLEQMAEQDSWDSSEQERIQRLALGKIAALQAIEKQETIVEQEPEQTGGRVKPKHKRRKLRWLLVALAVGALVVSLGTAAVATLSTDSRLLEALHADSQSQIARLDAMSTQIGQQVKADGYTVTMQQVISDRHNAWMLLEVEGPADVALDDERVFFRDTRVELEHKSSFGYTVYPLAEEREQDNKLSFILDLSTRNQLAGQTLALQFGNLTEHELNAALEIVGEQTLAEGPWAFTVGIPQQDFTVTMWQWKRIPYQKTHFLLQKIEVSPLSITLQANRLSRDSYTRLREKPLQVYLQDGTLLELRHSSGGSGGLGMQMQYDFPAPVELAEIEKIVYDGEVLNW